MARPRSNVFSYLGYGKDSAVLVPSFSRGAKFRGANPKGRSYRRTFIQRRFEPVWLLIRQMAREVAIGGSATPSLPTVLEPVATMVQACSA